MFAVLAALSHWQVDKCSKHSHGPGIWKLEHNVWVSFMPMLCRKPSLCYVSFPAKDSNIWPFGHVEWLHYPIWSTPWLWQIQFYPINVQISAAGLGYSTIKTWWYSVIFTGFPNKHDPQTNPQKIKGNRPLTTQNTPKFAEAIPQDR